MTKSECRKQYTEKRKQLSAGEIESRSEMILNTLLNTFDFNGKTISVFLPIQAKREINTYPILNKRTTLNYRVALPVAHFETNTMSHYLYEHPEQLITNEYGIPEPVTGTMVPTEEIDIVLVPLLCFDKKGYRVGYGKGFYDRFLSTCRPDCLFIGLSFFEGMDEIEDYSSNDVRLHACIANDTVYSF